MAPITELRLRNFKSRRDQLALELKPLTIFAGANNAGKSTVIQSILLLKQTLENQEDEQPLVLNGHILRMGSFNDVVHAGDRKNRLHMGFTSGSSSREAACDLTFGAGPKGWKPERAEDPDIYQLEPSLQKFSMVVKNHRPDVDPDEREETYSFKQSASNLTKRLDRLNVWEFLNNRGDQRGPDFYEALRYIPDRPNEWWERGASSIPFAPYKDETLQTAKDVPGVLLNHFLPKGIVLRVDRMDSTGTRDFLRVFRSGVDAVRSEAQQRQFLALRAREGRLLHRNEHIKLFLLTHTRQYQSELGQPFSDKANEKFDDLNERFNAMNWLKFLLSLQTGDRNALLDEILADEPGLDLAVRKGVDYQYSLVSGRLPRELKHACRNISDMLRDVTYIGPLRQAPKPVYAIAPGVSNSRNVGFAGENAIAVLNKHAMTNVKNVLPRSMDATLAPGGRVDIEDAPLAHAVGDWLKYMGILDDYQTKDRGKLGHEVQVRADARDRMVDLVHVGVGVSQVLPIVVQALIAPRDTVLIFEQPELHLHPRVQTRLADFFLAMTHLGKQCIVETHSEHLITRLRQRSAGAPGNEVAERIMIYFVEKEGGGQSEYRPVQINQYGVIEDWPAGFFDEGADQAAELLRLGMDKRMKGG